MGNTEQRATFSLFDGIRELLAEVKILYSLVYQLSGLLKASDFNTAGSDSQTQYTLFVGKISANLANDAKSEQKQPETFCIVRGSASMHMKEPGSISPCPILGACDKMAVGIYTSNLYQEKQKVD